MFKILLDVLHHAEQDFFDLFRFRLMRTHLLRPYHILILSDFFFVFRIFFTVFSQQFDQEIHGFIPAGYAKRGGIAEVNPDQLEQEREILMLHQPV